ncbi:sulfite exporter TauE/SafE family protein [Natrinema saccharevitans]|uniref:sulfite exporter TauE/SafE family protein n=1 Tax=Natrinema saccharevitans TaxID=301967 RepID=UPI00096CF278|nr:sulfite exporter TauE/SafE family protein [Natrinema saccharevitans]
MLESLLRVDVVLFVTIGLLGGAHCIGMCGPLVTMYAEQMSSRPDRETATTGSQNRRGHLTPYEVRQHALFNLGRTLSYALIGGAFGAFGGFVFVTTEQLTVIADFVRGSVGIIIGSFIIIAGVKYLLGGVSGVRIPGVQRITNRIAVRIDRYVNSPGIIGLGALHGLLPCPILYPAYLFAFATGSAVSGFLALGTLGIGTIPAVFAYGTLIESVDTIHRQRLHRLLGIVFIILGYILLTHGLMAIGIHLPHPMLPHYQPLGGAMNH